MFISSSRAVALTIGFIIASNSAAFAQTLSCQTSPSGIMYPTATTPVRATASISPELANYTVAGVMPCNSNNWTIGYNTAPNNQYFCDSFPLPANLDPAQGAILTVTTGGQTGGNDSIRVDRFPGAAVPSTPFRMTQPPIGGGTTANTAYAFNLTPGFIANAQSIGTGPTAVVDIVAADDTSVIATQLTYCPQRTEVRRFSYMVKYVCGLGIDEDLQEEARHIVANGTYRTEINFANPHHFPANLRKDVIPLVTRGESVAREPKQIGVQGGEDFGLSPVHASFDDCAAIGRMLGVGNLSNDRISIGFLNFVSDVGLEIEAVTTASSLKDDPDQTTVPALHIHHYEPTTVLIAQ